MPASVVTVDELVRRVGMRAGFALDDTGQYLDAPDGTTEAIRDGLYQGLLAVGVVPADPLILSDDDAAGLGGAAVLRVTAWGELECCRRALARWHRAVQTQGIPAVARSEDVRGGWLYEEKQELLRRVGELEAIVASPFADPLGDTSAYVNRDPSCLPCVGPLFPGDCP